MRYNLGTCNKKSVKKKQRNTYVQKCKEEGNMRKRTSRVLAAALAGMMLVGCGTSITNIK